MLPPSFFYKDKTRLLNLIIKINRPNHSDTKKLDHFIISNSNPNTWKNFNIRSHGNKTT